MLRARHKTAGLLGLVLLLAGRATGWAVDPPLGGARISAVEGEAQVQLGEDGTWKAAPLHMPLLPDDRLQVGPTGRLEVLLSSGTVIRLSPASSARLIAVPPSEPAGDAAAELDLEAGRAIVTTADGERSRPAVVLNATGTRIHIYPRSQVEAEAIAPDATEVALRGGAATVDALGASVPLRMGETLQAGRGSTSLVAGRPLDAFDEWSETRNRALAAAPAASPYLPAPLGPDASDLNRYGQWTSVPEYGHVWRPTTVVAGWAPFTTGRWVWRAETWVWLPVEPWGWLPFHYGRWRWDPFLGWYWVPPRSRAAVVWCPGAVAWIRTPSLVSWIPLAPGEIYYAPRPYGIWSAPVPTTTVINITHVHIRRTFVNAAAPAALAAAPSAAFSATRAVSPTVTRVNVATFGANQSIAVVTPAALAPARATPTIPRPRTTPSLPAPLARGGQPTSSMQAGAPRQTPTAAIPSALIPGPGGTPTATSATRAVASQAIPPANPPTASPPQTVAAPPAAPRPRTHPSEGKPAAASAPATPAGPSAPARAHAGVASSGRPLAGSVRVPALETSRPPGGLEQPRHRVAKDGPQAESRVESQAPAARGHASAERQGQGDHASRAAAPENPGKRKPASAQNSLQVK